MVRRGQRVRNEVRGVYGVKEGREATNTVMRGEGVSGLARYTV